MRRFAEMGRWAWLAVVVAVIGCGGEPGQFEEGNTGAQEARLVGASDESPSALLDVVGSISISPRNTQLPLGEQLCVKATVRSLTASLMADVNVNFTVVGANAKVGSALTTPSGEATFCYTGSVGGQDTITAGVGLVIDTTVHVWKAVGVITLSPKNDSHNVGQQHCVTATVLDTLGLGMPAQNVDFAVAGAHTRSGSALTNLSGEASFCYTGSVGGQDTITASVLLFSDTALHTWVVPNQGVWVSAGPDVSGHVTANIALHGEAGDPDGDPLTIQWSYTVDAGTNAQATCAFSNANVLTPAIRCTHVGSYTVKLTVSDGRGSIAFATAKVTVTNRSAWVNAGPDVSGIANANIALQAEAGDPDGDPLTFQWSYTVDADTDELATCTFSNPKALSPDVRCTHLGSYTVTLTVSDGHGSIVSDSAKVSVTNGANVTMCRMNRYTNQTNQRLCGFATPGKGGAPIVDVWFTVDNGAEMHTWPPKPENVSSGFTETYTVLTEGTHIIRMHARSQDGTLTIRSLTVTVDLTAPSLTIVSPKANSTQSSTVVTVTSSVSDGIPVRVSTQYAQTSEVASGSGSVTHTIDLGNNRGWQNILVRAFDAANNLTEVWVRVYIE